MAADLKEQGNTLFKEGDFLKAAAAYTKAIKQDPQSNVLYRYLLVVSFLQLPVDQLTALNITTT